MDIQEIRHAIMREEAEFPKLFTSCVERDYGLLFHNAHNKESNDSNHAFIYPEKITDVAFVLNDIADFYMGRGLGARFSIYHPLVHGYFIDNAQVLQDNGYRYAVDADMRIMLLTEKSSVNVPKRLEIRRIMKWDEDVAHDVLTCVANKEHFKDVINNSMSDGYYLFIGYLGNEAASLLGFHVSRYGITRFDDMGTAETHKNNGFAREMNGFAVDFVRENNLPIAYQWPAHSTSERITTEAGFRVAFTLPSGYAALAE